jgi:energy-coupling factor transporter ATP-binding protein EcfA2
MIRFEHVSVTYRDAPAPTLRDVDLTIPEGELCLVTGTTGTGKTTLLRAVNGLVPHFTGGTLAGRVVVDGRDTRDHPPRELADVVGVVGQDPLAGFATDVVETELAYGMEQLGLVPAVMRKRVEETLDLLGIAELRNRPLRELSGGQQQRVAIGSVLTAHPRVLVLDEPTSALDPTAAEEVLSAITRLVHDLGVTVLVAEHRLERVVQYADRILVLAGDGSVADRAPSDAMVDAPVAPPVVHLGRLARWTPLPLSVRDARRRAPEMRAALGSAQPDHQEPIAGESLLTARGIVVHYGNVAAVRDVDVDFHAGTITALMGRNGSGKSSLLWAVQGSGRRTRGTVRVGDTDPAALDPAAARRHVGLVPQTPSDLLYLPAVAAECEQADDESGRERGTTASLLERIVPGIDGDAHPRDLSEGQRLALVLAVQLAAQPRVVLLDEPTRGLDYAAKERLTVMLRALAESGHAVVVATHDVEFVAGAADRVVVMAQGEIVADGPTADVVVASPAFAPQIARIMHPDAWLTVAAIEAALAGSPV